jgi:uncharacterized protein (DUF488 family)
MPPKVWALGYDGHLADTLIAVLVSERISTVVDVRWTASSRKKGFSKSALWTSLAEADVDYRHLRELGAPKPLRDALSVSKDFPAFARSYQSHLGDQSEALEALSELVRTRQVCVLCLEANPEECHRSLLADRLRSNMGVEVVHLQ